QRPSLKALLPRLVERDELAAAGALESMRSTFGMILGPAVAGLLIAAIGLPSTYGGDIATFAVSLIAPPLMLPAPPPAQAEPPSVRRVVEGLRYARARPELLGTYLVDMIAMFFGMPTALFPAFAAQFAPQGMAISAPTVLGLLYAAPAIGSL